VSDAAPAVSVCIPAFNAAQFLPRAIETALGQEFDDIEVVVVDNASKDTTREVCQHYSDPRFRYEYESTPGQASAWNRCVQEATGRYVILLHADDELEPRFLTRAVEVLDSNEDVVLVNCAVEHIDEGGGHLQLQKLFDSDRVDREGVVLRRLLLEGCVINPVGVLVRRKAYDTAGGGFTDRVVWGVDWHMWIRIAMGGAVAYVAEPLARYRQHTASGTSGVMTSARNGKDEMWVLDDVFRIAEQRRPDVVKLQPDARHGVADRTWWMAEHMCREGQMGAARKGLRNAIAFRPALAAKPRSWALGAATFLGYDWFERTQARRRRSGGVTVNR
jgi:glycosyltransferase involved in cell wall biosynthesis